jgi:hypothetical protein
MAFLYETHMHTSEVSACAISSAEQQVSFYKELGYSGIIVTDHFINGYTTCPKKYPWEKKMKYFASGYLKAKEAGDLCGLDVFFGWEFTVRGSDFLTYGLDLDFLLNNPGVDDFGIEKYSTLVRSCGGFLAQAHPYRDAYYIDHKYPVAPYLIDAVEVYNVMDKDEANAKAYAFANANDLPMQAGTDSHRTNGHLYTGIKLREKAKSIHDIINAIKSKEVTLVY